MTDTYTPREVFSQFSKKYAFGRLALQGRDGFFDSPYGTFWILTGEVSVALCNGDTSQARAAVDAFVILLRAKLASGDRSTTPLFCAIRLTEASGAGGYRNNLTAKLDTQDMAALWETIDSVPVQEWAEYRHDSSNSNLRQMIERATGRF